MQLEDSRLSSPFRAIPLCVCLVLFVSCGPIGPIPGGELRGELQVPPASWASIAGVETYQLETRPRDPHSINIWGAVMDDRFYIATSLILVTDPPAECAWVQNTKLDPNVRLRAESRIFELRATRVTDETEAERARSALMQKYEVEADEDTSAAWIYRLDRR